MNGFDVTMAFIFAGIIGVCAVGSLAVIFAGRMSDMKLPQRAASYLFCVSVGLVSGAFNTWTAFNLAEGTTGYIFATGMLFIELLAIVTFDNIMKDWNNCRHFKALAGMVIHSTIIVLCVSMGLRGIDALNVDLKTQNEIRIAQADMQKETAESYRLLIDAEVAKGSPAISLKMHWKQAIREEKKLRAEVEKKPQLSMVFAKCLLIAFEGVKLFGLFVLCRETTRSTVTLSRRIAGWKDKRDAFRLDRSAKRQAAEIAAEAKIEAAEIAAAAKLEKANAKAAASIAKIPLAA